MIRFPAISLRCELTSACRTLHFMILILAMVALVACGGAKQVAQTEVTPPAPPEVVSQPEAAPVETPPQLEEAKMEAAAPAPLLLENVYFDFDKYDLKPGTLQTLEANASGLQTHADVSVTIEGHCDERGTVEYNLALGDRRAKAAKDYLVSLGIAASRISTISYGKERPVDSRHNEEAWAKNRRAAFVIR